MDIYQEQVGRGVGGRMADVLEKNGFSATTVSLNGITDTLVTKFAKTFILDPSMGFYNLNPMSWAQPLWDKVKKIKCCYKFWLKHFWGDLVKLTFQSGWGK
jgi:hypothetical protein